MAEVRYVHQSWARPEGNAPMPDEPDQHADAVADAGVACPVDGRDGWHGIRYAEGDWYCPHCFASLRLGVWYPARNDSDGVDGVMKP